MLRLLIVADGGEQELDMWERAREAVDQLGPGTSAEIVPVPAGTGDAARLDAGLYRRPLPDRLVVVGVDASCSAAELVFLCVMSDLRPELAAITTGGDLGPAVSSILELGGIFAAGPLCQAGGFLGDGVRSVHDRLHRIGFDTAVLPDALPCRTVAARHPQLLP